MTQILQVAALGIVTLGTGAATVAVMNDDIPDLTVPAGDWSADGLLDGRSFHVVGKDLDSGRVLEDELIFRDGTFQSVNCQTYCDFGWSEYETTIEGDAIHFTARTICPDAPHTVVWHGSVTGDDAQVDVSWTTRRWYWTHQIRAAVSGSSTPPDGEDVSG